MGSTDNDWTRTKWAQPSVTEATLYCRATGIRGDAIAVVLAATKGCRGIDVGLRERSTEII